MVRLPNQMAPVHSRPRGPVLHDAPEQRKRDVHWGRAATQVVLIKGDIFEDLTNMHFCKSIRTSAQPDFRLSRATRRTRSAQRPVRLVRLVHGDARAGRPVPRAGLVELRRWCYSNL